MVTYIPACSLVVAHLSNFEHVLVICAKDQSLLSTQMHILST
jgi:hypothetical protein